MMLQVALLSNVKIIIHWLGLERISISPLLSAIAVSTVFVLSFLLSGVLADFKESEKYLASYQPHLFL